MKCPSPLSLPRTNGEGPQDRITVPCGKCVNCLSNQRADWTFRLKEELKNAKSAHFLTLTYSDENLRVYDYHHDKIYEYKHVQESNRWLETLSKKDVQLFIKRLRANQENYIQSLHLKHKIPLRALKWPKIRYFIAGEYGPKTIRPHYHAIIFNIHPDIIGQIEKTWGLGQTHCGTVTGNSIGYVTKYCITRKTVYIHREAPFSIMSRRPPLGLNYLIRMKKWHQENGIDYVHSSSSLPQRMPRIYKDKIFNEYEKDVFIGKQIREHDQKTIHDIQNKDDYFQEEQLRIRQQDEKLRKLLSKNSKL